VTDATTIRWESGADGIVVLTLDDPEQSANTMNAAYRVSMDVILDRLQTETDSVTGVVITSAKKTFFAGGDLGELIESRPEDAAEVTARTNRMKAQLRRLETLGKPVVAAINGAALGGGLEIALACHHRIAADLPGVVIGLPEVTLGLLPGGGGVVRTVRLLGIQNALRDVLLSGQRYEPARAVELGLVDELVLGVDELVPKAKEWIRANPGAVQPWDAEDYHIPGGAPSDPWFAASLPSLPAQLRKQLRGAPMPAPRAILAAAVEGAQVGFDTAQLIETRYFVSLATGQVAKNMSKAFFFDLQQIRSGGSRPEGYRKHRARKVGVLGAGVMGAGIAYVTAKAGIDVVLKDVSRERADRGKGYSVALEDKAISRKTTTTQASQELLARITPTADPADFADVDFVIEAVFESPELKQKVFGEIENIVRPDAVLGSNTSTLPITGLAQAVGRQADFVGVHFFSPVDRMPLVEIIRGQLTSDATVARVIDFALQIGKTPIVVNDGRGFFTSRVILTFLNEAAAALGEGVAAATIEQAALQAGYPAPPLQLLDDLTLTLPRAIQVENRAAVEAAGGVWRAHSSETVVNRMIDEFGRAGRSSGAGFYAYDQAGKRLGLWPGLRDAFQSGRTRLAFRDLQERMLFAEALEAARCFDEGVITSVPDANIGSNFGIGFPAWTGGVIQYMNQYDGGLRGFVDRARELAVRYGNHFSPPASLIAKAEEGGTL
jgi:3-hydroxyacyl-CoA dehydrogenase/enoyl-CoA hydratase/3-hydroxybutyryl-CoA epimerase